MTTKMCLRQLLVVHWSILVLFTSLKPVLSASLHSSSSSDVVTGSGNSSPTRGLISTVTLPPPLPISPFFKSTLSSPHQSMCFAETEHFLSVGGKDSTITLDLEPNRLGQMGACKRTFIAPEPHGFIVKLIRFKSKQMRNPNSHIDAKTGGVSVDVYNETATCPLIISSGKDILLPPLKLDPCQMEAKNETIESVRLMSGWLRVSWTSNNHSPKYKLLITTFGKGNHCKQGQHPCLRYGDETLFCISSSLICDGIHQCPSGDEYFNDEDTALCAKLKKNTDTTSNGLSLWQQITREFFSKVYPSDVDSSTKPSNKSTPGKHMDSSSTENDDDSSGNENKSTETTTKRHRVTLPRGLSKYGPWGYLILGMLLCGGALLLCVLWGGSTNAPNYNASTVADATMPPNYDEIDPPPSYSTLFPGNKSIGSTSSNEDVATSVENGSIENNSNDANGNSQTTSAQMQSVAT